MGGLDTTIAILETHNEGLKSAAESIGALSESVRVLTGSVEQLAARVGALEEMARLRSAPPTVRPSRWRSAALMIEEVLIQICKNPVAAIIGAILIGLAIAVIQVECGPSPGR